MTPQGSRTWPSFPCLVSDQKGFPRVVALLNSDSEFGIQTLIVISQLLVALTERQALKIPNIWCLVTKFGQWC